RFFPGECKIDVGGRGEVDRRGRRTIEAKIRASETSLLGCRRLPVPIARHLDATRPAALTARCKAHTQCQETVPVYLARHALEPVLAVKPDDTLPLAEWRQRLNER